MFMKYMDEDTAEPNGGEAFHLSELAVILFAGEYFFAW